MNGLIEGNSEFLIKLRVESLENAVRQQGWVPTHVQGSVAGSAEAAVAGNLFFGAKQVLFIWDPAKDIPGISRVMEMSDDSLLLFLIHMGTPAERKKLKTAFPLLRTETHSEEQRKWKRKEFAAQWIREHAKSLGADLDEKLAVELVRKVGDDLGFLRWEIFKANMLREGSEITPHQLKACMAPIAEIQPSEIIEALERRSEAGLLRAAAQFRRRAARGETSLVMWACASLTPVLVQWAAVLHLKSLGVPASLMHQKLNISKWKLENVVIPACRMWTVSEVSDLLKALSHAEQGVYRGFQSPWTTLVSRMASAVRVE